MWNPSTCDCEHNKPCKIDEYLNIKNCPCKKRPIGKLVLGCEDEILNTTESSLDDKKITWKSNYLIHTISLVAKCLWLLVAIFINYYYFYTKDWIKKKYAWLYFIKLVVEKKLILNIVHTTFLWDDPHNKFWSK